MSGGGGVGWGGGEQTGQSHGMREGAADSAALGPFLLVRFGGGDRGAMRVCTGQLHCMREGGREGGADSAAVRAFL